MVPYFLNWPFSKDQINFGGIYVDTQFTLSVDTYSNDLVVFVRFLIYYT